MKQFPCRNVNFTREASGSYPTLDKHVAWFRRKRSWCLMELRVIYGICKISNMWVKYATLVNNLRQSLHHPLESECFIYKVDGSWATRPPNRNPCIDWYVARWGSKSQHYKNTWLKEIGVRLWLLITTLHSILNTIGEDMGKMNQTTPTLPY